MDNRIISKDVDLNIYLQIWSNFNWYFIL